MQHIKLMAEYGGTVLWPASGQMVGPIEPASLPLSNKLLLDLRKWADWYDSFLDPNCPQDSRFATPREEADFEVEGRRLWRELDRELGLDFKVDYYSETEGRIIEYE